MKGRKITNVNLVVKLCIKPSRLWKFRLIIISLKNPCQPSNYIEYQEIFVMEALGHAVDKLIEIDLEINEIVKT